MFLLHSYKFFIKIQVDNVKALGESDEHTDNDIMLVAISSVQLLSRVQCFCDSVARQAPLSVGFSRQECWDGLPFPSPGDLPDPGKLPRLHKENP